MAEFATPVAPPKRVWQQIEQRLHLKPQGGWSLFRDALSFWRTLGMASSAIAALLVIVVATRVMDAPQISYVASLTDEKAQTAMLLTADSRHGALEVRMVGNAPVPADRDLELWAVPKSGNPRSLGLLADKGNVKLALSQRAIGNDVALLAVTLEPKGGSPNPNGPTGPVLYKGNWVKI